MNTRTAELAGFAAQLRFDDLPTAVVRKAEDLLVDWFGSAVAGHGSRPVETIGQFAVAMGPGAGPGNAELLAGRSFTSALPRRCDAGAAGPRVDGARC